MNHRRITLALVAAALAAWLAVTPVAADPNWPPRPVKQGTTFCVQGRSVSGCVTTPRWFAKRVDKLFGIQRVCNVPGKVCK